MNLMAFTISALLHKSFFIAAGIFGIGFVIAFHELGHFLFCKLFHIRTPSFSIGFGPKLISKKIGQTEFSISAIPLGGYVEIATAQEDGSDSNANDLFDTKPYYQQLAVMFGGILFNLIFVYTVFSLVFMMGLPKSAFVYPLNSSPIIEKIIPESAAQKSGLQEGDILLKINDTPLNNNTMTLIKELKPLAGTQAEIIVERNSKKKTLRINIGTQKRFGEKVGSLGAIFAMHDMPGTSFVDGIKKGVNLTNNYIINALYGLAHLFKKRDTSSMSGPIAIISETIKGAEKGLKVFLLLLAVISLNLAVLNLLPLPILDGGQILFRTIEAIIRRPLSMKVKEYIHITSWLFIMALTIYISAKDIAKVFGSYIQKIVSLFS